MYYLYHKLNATCQGTGGGWQRNVLGEMKNNGKEGIKGPADSYRGMRNEKRVDFG